MFTKSTVVFQRTQRLFYFTRSFNRAVNTCYITIPNRTKYYTSCVAHVMCTQYESYSVKLPESICSGENSMRFKRDRYCCSNTLVVFPFGMGTCSMYGNCRDHCVFVYGQLLGKGFQWHDDGIKVVICLLLVFVSFTFRRHCYALLCICNILYMHIFEVNTGLHCFCGVVWHIT